MLLTLYIVIAIMAFIAIARVSGSAKNKQGSEINQIKRDPAPNETHFTVSTFNIQGGKNTSGERDITRAGQAIKNSDVVGIQEVYAPGYANMLGIGSSQTNTLATIGRFDWLFCATRTRWFREFRGNALLSKLNVESWRIEMLPNKVGKNFRNMTVVKMSWQGESFHFINTHLHTKQGKEEQFKAVINEFNKYPRAILVGDFNSKPDESHIVNALKEHAIDDAIGLSEIDKNDKDRIDWILTKGFNIHNGHMLEKGISDHPYYQVTLSIK